MPGDRLYHSGSEKAFFLANESDEQHGPSGTLASLGSLHPRLRIFQETHRSAAVVVCPVEHIPGLVDPHMVIVAGQHHDFIRQGAV